MGIGMATGGIAMCSGIPGSAAPGAPGTGAGAEDMGTLVGSPPETTVVNNTILADQKEAYLIRP